MKPNLITAQSEGPLNDICFAVNHYISTGDHIGEGVGFETETAWVLNIPVNPNLRDDVEDWEKLKSRLNLLVREGGADARLEPALSSPAALVLYTLTIPKDTVRPFCRALMEKPGSRGWGTGKFAMDNTWGVHRQLAVARVAGVWIGSVQPAGGGDVRAALEGKIDPTVLSVGTQVPASYWWDGEEYYLD